MGPEYPRCDIFCRVIDNFGDAGVCWRLAKALQAELHWRVHLWIDRPQLIERFEQLPLTESAPKLHPWAETTVPWSQAKSPDILIEAFGCAVPEQVLDAMEQATSTPIWLNLEYFSCEPWVDRCHGLASPQTGRNLKKFVFIPGLSEHSGGILAEKSFRARRRAFDPIAWRRNMGLPENDSERMTMTVFAYPHAPFHALLQSMIAAQAAWDVVLPGVRGEPSAHGTVRVFPLPFLPQDQFDELLWASDVVFVRGEDSMTRALLAGVPFVWHIYRQDANAHHCKLEALLGAWALSAEPKASLEMIQIHRCWNALNTPPQADQIVKLFALRGQFWSQAESRQLAPSLTERLAQFVCHRIKY